MINLNVTLVIQLVNFLLLMFLLDRILFRPMVRILDERKERTVGRQQAAAQIDAQAESTLATYQASIQEARAEADRLRASLIREAETQRQNLLDQASEEADKTLATIRARVRAEADRARADLRTEAQRLAESAAAQILGRTV